MRFEIGDVNALMAEIYLDAPTSFVVYCDAPLEQDRLAAVARLIDQAKPAHVAYRLRVKATGSEGDAA